MKSSPASYSNPAELPRVALLIDTSTQWCRQIIMGINSYIKEHKDWHVFIEPHGSNEIIEIPKGWKGEGIIANIHNLESAKKLARLNIPIVNVSSQVLPPAFKFPQISVDLTATGQLAVDYFRLKGFSSFGYIGFRENSWDDVNCKTFVQMVEKAGHSCSVYKVKPKVWGGAEWNLSTRDLGDWLAALPKPVAIFSWGIGREVIYACRYANLRIPDEVSLLLLGFDEVFCEIGHLTLSGIRHALTSIGYEAAKCLDEMMSGKKLKTLSHFFPPTGVESRRSTDALALSDPALLAALNLVHSQAHHGLQVDELARHAGVSRRILERRFLGKLDCSPGEYIRNVRFERAKKLLRETTLSIPDVAEASGFSTAEYMANSFQKELGVSPLKYRKQGRFNS